MSGREAGFPGVAAWCAPDALHLRQLARRLPELTALRGGAYDVGYAGDW